MRLYCKIERKTGVGPATSTLARWRSTTELFPHFVFNKEKKILERKTGVGPATSTLARWRSTTELFPHKLLTKELCERRDLNPYAEALDPKSSVSANFTTLAKRLSSKSAAQSILGWYVLSYRKVVF